MSTEMMGTTVDAPLCSECGGTCEYRMAAQYEYIPCPSCNATGYERGDEASLLASVPPDETYDGFVVPSRYEQATGPERVDTYIAGTLAANSFVINGVGR